MKRYLLLLTFNLIVFSFVFSQNSDSVVIRKMFNEALNSKESYKNLEYLCKKIGARLTGSPQAAAAVEFTKQVMDNMGLDSVYLQEMTVPVWVRGEKETANMTSSIFGSKELNVTALGKSVGTGIDGIYGEVVEVKSDKELDSLANVKPAKLKSNTKNSELKTLNFIKGKIVLFNRAADQTFINTFESYGGSVGQRASGPSQAAKYGAIGAIVRSSTQGDDNNPHTGGTHYVKDIPQIPAFGISVNHADLLSKCLKKDAKLIVYLRSTCHYNKDTKTYNVVGVIKGTEHPEKIITVGGHLDSWDTGEGAHDDGTGAVQSIEVLRIYKALNIKPKNTIRGVMFMDEELYQTGGNTYLANAVKKHEQHITAIESDRGGTTPIAMSVVGSKEVFNKTSNFINIMNRATLTNLLCVKQGSGVDIGPLEKLNIPAFGLVPDSQRYFDYHHSYNDRFENVNRREMQLGAATMAAFIFLIDKYGL